MSSAPLVTVVIPAYNAEATLQRAIGSVVQERRVPLELIVVDDGSTDLTPSVVDAVAEVDPRARRITRPNGHVAAACNTGIRAASGKYVAFLEADDEWLAGKLRRQLEILESHPEVGAVFSNFYNHDEVTGSRYIYFEQQRNILQDLPQKRIAESGVIIDGDVRRYLIQSNFVLCSAIVVRRDLLLELGGFDESLKGAQDWDLWFRLGGKTRFAYVEEPLATRHKRSDSMSRPSAKWFRTVIRSREKAFATARGTPELQQALPLLRERLRLLYRALVSSHVTHWEWFSGCSAFIKGAKYGLDPLALLILLAGLLGPAPFAARRFLLRRLSARYRLASA